MALAFTDLDNKNAEDLLQRYIIGNVAENEIVLVESWYLNDTQNSIHQDIDNQVLEQDQYESLNLLLTKIYTNQKTYARHYIAAASLLIVLFVGILLKENKQQMRASVSNDNYPNKSIYHYINIH